MNDDLRAVTDALAEAMRVVQRHAEQGVEVEYKEHGSPVTECDREVDALLRDMLPRGDDGWMSEESTDDPERMQRRRVWIVDPLDGTRAFVAGRNDYAVSIALLVDGEPVLGAVGNPVYGLTVVGGPGHGLQIRGEPDWHWPKGTPRPRVLASRSEIKRGEWRPFEQRFAIRPVGSVALKLALVAGGFADATWTLQPKHEWDVAAGAALVRAAGGDLWLPRGGHLKWNRLRPRFLSFAAALPGLRPEIEVAIAAGRDHEPGRPG